MKKVLSVLLTAFLIAGVFVGCEESVAIGKEILQKNDHTETEGKEAKYQKTATIYITNQSSAGQTSISGDALNAKPDLSATYVRIIESDRVKEQVLEQFPNAEFTVEAENIENTEIYKITVGSESEEGLADICNALAESACGNISNMIAGISCKIVDTAK